MRRVSARLPEAIRVAATSLDLARRAFPAGAPEVALSFERLGQLRDQQGDRTGEKPFLIKAHALHEAAPTPDPRALYR